MFSRTDLVKGFVALRSIATIVVVATTGAIATMIAASSIAYANNASPEKPDHNNHENTPDSVYGDWVNPDMDAVISIRPCGSELCAELIDHDYVDVSTDIMNPNPDLRQRPLLGVHILEGLKKTAEKKWQKGKLYDPRTGKTYASKVKIINANALKISGCVGPGLCKGYVWTRQVNEQPSSTILEPTHHANDPMPIIRDNATHQ